MSHDPALGQAVLELVTDDSKLEGGLAAAKSKTQGWAGGMAGIAKGAALAIAGVGAAASGIIGALTASAISVASDAKEVAKLKREMGFTTEEASKLKYAAGRLGVDVDGLSKSFGTLSKNIAADKLAEYRIQVTKTKDGHVDLRATLDTIADRFAAMPDGVEKTAMALDIFGKSGKDLIPLLNKGSVGLKDLGSEAAKLGLVFDDKTLAATKRLSDAKKDLGDRVEGLKNRVGIAFLPVLADWTGGLVKLADLVLPPVASGLQKVIGFVGGLREAFDKSPLRGFVDQLFAGIAKLPGMLGLVFGSLGEMFDVLSGRRPDAGATLRSLIGDEGAVQTMRVLAGVREAVKVAWDKIGDILEGAKERLGPVFEQLKKWIGELHDKWDDLPGPLKQYATDIAAAAVVTTAAGPAFLGVAANIAQIVGAVGGLALRIPGLAAFFGTIVEGVALVVGGAATFTEVLALWAAGLAGLLFVPVMLTLILAGLIFIFQHTEDLAAIWQAFTYAAGAVWRQLGSVIGDVAAAIGGFFSGIGAGVRDFLEFWGGAWAAFAERPAHWIGVVLGLVTGALLNLAAAIGKFTGEFVDTVKRWGSETIVAVSEFMGLLPGRIGAFLKEGLDVLGRFVGTFLEVVRRWISDTKSNIFDFFGALPGRLWQIARDAVQGFVDGVRSMISSVVGAVGDFAGGFLSGLKSALGIRSPSMVLMGIGRNAALGFAMGLSSGLPAIDASVSAIGARLGLEGIPSLPAAAAASDVVDRPILVQTAVALQVDGRELARVNVRQDNDSSRRYGMAP